MMLFKNLIMQCDVVLIDNHNAILDVNRARQANSARDTQITRETRKFCAQPIT
jgi:hypothetical protein